MGRVIDDGKKKIKEKVKNIKLTKKCIIDYLVNIEQQVGKCN